MNRKANSFQYGQKHSSDFPSQKHQLEVGRENPLVEILKASPDQEEVGINSSIARCNESKCQRSELCLESVAEDNQKSNDKSTPSLYDGIKSPQFSDQFDAYLYQSQHITSPVLTPTFDIDLVKYTSTLSPVRLQNPSDTISLEPTNNLLNPDRDVDFNRRASHAGGFYPCTRGSPTSTSENSWLTTPLVRDRGKSLPCDLVDCGIYTFRKFSVSGRKVTHHGDSYRSQSISYSSSKSR